VKLAPNAAWRSRGYLWHHDGAGLTHHIVFCLADAFGGDALPAEPALRRRLADERLDRLEGARLLDNAEAASIVEEALLHFDGERYRLLAWCVMPNHVHALIHVERGRTLARVVHAWKSFTAHAINTALGRTGPVWQREYFDRFIRDDAHYFATVKYIERNPVAAGLADEAEDWAWSSATRRAR
jgi:REP element-mobilizing transposase RayT